MGLGSHGAVILQVRSRAYCARATCDKADSIRKLGTENEILPLLSVAVRRFGTSAVTEVTLPELLANWRKPVRTS